MTDRHPAPWQQGKTIPFNVFDADGEGVISAPSAELAERIVIAVNSQWHPDIVRLKERIDAAVAHGYTEGDVNHNVQPVIGFIRLIVRRNREHGGTAATINLTDLEHWAQRLVAACDAETAWLNSMGEEPSDGREGTVVGSDPG